ncbi:hypothetical protein, partial [Listeria monocytogenes]|uniref:hypothetical protein n=1 Tax=Listeria monocytogenes TaxID=1639 RepID=UPI002FDC2229
ISNPIVLTAEFQIPSTLNSFWLNLNDPNGNYYQAMVSTSQLSLVRYLNSASTTLSSSPITLQTNTLYVLSLSYDKNGHVTVSLYPE